MNTRTKLLNYLKSIVILSAFGIANNVMAYDFTVDGIYYSYGNIESTVSVVSGYQKYKGDVVIPSTVKNNGITYTVTTIEQYALDLCPELISVKIPNSVTYIGKMALTGCPNLESIVVDNTNEVYDSRNNCNAVIESSSNTLLFGCKNTIIPNTISSIGYSAFDSSSQTSMIIPNSVISIDDRAFAYCANMTSITIGNSLSSIGHRVFEGCNELTSIVVNGYNSTFDSRNNCNAVIETSTNTLVAGCKNTIIPSSIIAIGNYAFSGCYYLPNITIPNSVTAIGDHAFHDCRFYLTSIDIPNSVTSIGKNAFSSSALKTVNIPNSVLLIDDYAFAYCNLTSITCMAVRPPTVGANAFSYYNSTTLYVPEHAVNDYQVADVWKNFSTIIGINWPKEKYDVNGDGNVSISDVTFLINYLLTNK